MDTLIRKFSNTTRNQEKAIFSTIFIAGNRLQTLFDSHIPELSLKQFMLLSLARQAPGQPTLTRLGAMMGCSRQNIKKLAAALQKKGFITLAASPEDARKSYIHLTGRAEEYFRSAFLPYQEELHALFAVYTEEEISALFHLLSKLYAGIDRLEALSAPNACRRMPNMTEEGSL